MYQKMLLGMFAGGAASVVGNPADLALVRMQADSVMPPAQRRGYRGITDAVVRIVREEGVAALWRGSAPTVLRAVFLNMALLATSDQIKEMLAPVLGGKSSLSNLFVSSMAGGVAAALASLPFDMVKTRLQRMAPGPDGRMPYAGVLDCMRKIAAREGLAALYTVRSLTGLFCCAQHPCVRSPPPPPTNLLQGLWPTYVLRIGPYGFVTLVASDLITTSLQSARKAAEAADAAMA